MWTGHDLSVQLYRYILMMKDRKKNRLEGYDYSSDNLYFVTSNVKDHICSFGKVINAKTGHDLSVHNSYPDEFSGKMILNYWGQIAYGQWHWLEKKYPYISLHDFIVMPNHVHATIQIDSAKVDQERIKTKS